MATTQSIFPAITLQPHWIQFTINQLHWIVLCAAIFLGIYIIDNDISRYILAVANILLIIYLIYKIICLVRIKYVITGDQIIYLHGVFSHATDYIELYRVIDYRQERSFMQQITGLKTVIIFSGDRNTPVMEIIGVKESNNVIQDIRNRVEFNKTQKHIYEITNRM